MDKVTKKIEIYDKDHIYMDGCQYISLSKMNEKRKSLYEDIVILDEKVKELEEENKSLKILLKDKLNKELGD